jgi:polynucleotide 5'-kinase involved in rRNA processing
LPADALGVRNAQSSVDERKSIFSMNESWTESLDFLVKSLGAQSKVLVNGVANSGKSTFSSCLINQILTRTKKEVYLLDVDPG